MSRSRYRWHLAALAIAVLVLGTGCSAIGSAIGQATAGFIDGLRTPGSKVELRNATVTSAPRVLESGKDRGSVHLTVARTGGVNSELYCPPKLAAKCLELRPGQVLKGVKGELTEARKQTAVASFGREGFELGDKAERLAGPDPAQAEALWEEARLMKRVPEAGPRAPRDVILVSRINPRKQ